MRKRTKILLECFAKKVCSGAMTVTMLLSLVSMPVVAAQTGEGVTISNPRIVKEVSYQAARQVTYDRVTFGSYPQAEVVANVEDEETVYDGIRNGNDYIVDSELYEKLTEATDWDDNGDIVIEGKKYRRLDKWHVTDATYQSSAYFKWDSDYHYFKYQPITWRVLAVEDETVFLLAEQALDCQEYNIRDDSVTWETSSIRSFLNSYAAAYNQDKEDYSSKGFLNTAFTEEERNAIYSTKVVNANSLAYDTKGGRDTQDKIFLLSESEVYAKQAKAYGFVNRYDILDEAKRVKSSTYAKAMGCYSSREEDKASGTSYAGNCYWWLRSPGDATNSVAASVFSGEVSRGCNVVNTGVGVCPAIKINLTSCNLLTGAGTITTAKTSTAVKYQHIYSWKVTKAATQEAEGEEVYICCCGDAQNTRTVAKRPKPSVPETATIPQTPDATQTSNVTQMLAATQPVSGKAVATIRSIKKKTCKASTLKRKKLTIKLKARTNSNGKLTYKVTKYPKKAKKYIRVSKKGVVTLRKGAVKGKYKITITATPTDTYEMVSKIVTITVK